jgi:hypothetical protein
MHKTKQLKSRIVPDDLLEYCPSIEEIQEIGEHFCAAICALLERLFYAAVH